MGLICVFLMSNDAECLFMCMSAPHVSRLGTYLFRSSAHLKKLGRLFSYPWAFSCGLDISLGPFQLPLAGR